MTAGTMFAIWLGELISEYGIRGQGLSLVIFAGIVSQIPENIGHLWLDEQNRWILLAAMMIVIVVTVLAIVYVQQGRRNVPIMYPQKSQVFYAIQRGKSVQNASADSALDGQPVRYDPVDLCQCHPAVPGDHCQLLYSLTN